MSPFWNIVGKPLAALGGRSFEEMKGRSASECDKSVAVGVLCLLSGGIIFAGHWLFWSNFAHLADVALEVAGSIALLFMLMYRIALRVMETMAGLAKALVLTMLGTLMGINAMLAGHELVLLAFKPQVEAQAALGAAKGVTAYADAVEASLGLPRLRSQQSDLDQALNTAQFERNRVPETVAQLQAQTKNCDAQASRLRQAIPADADQPGYENARRSWRKQAAHCRKLLAEARSALDQHQRQLDKQLAELDRSRAEMRQSLTEADAKRKDKVDSNAPTITAAATTGFARHNALWGAVDTGTVPAWAAYGLMAAVLLIDVFSFVIKLLARDDAATVDRVHQAGADAVFNGLYAATVKQQRRLTPQVVREMRTQTADDLASLARNAVLPSVAQDVEARSFTRAAAANQRARQRHGAPVPSMLGRLGAMGAKMHGGFQ